ncbi:MAG: M1 family aminopeptidase [Polyangiaceae bacterium]
MRPSRRLVSRSPLPFFFFPVSALVAAACAPKAPPASPTPPALAPTLAQVVAPALASEEVPALRLPADTRPLSERLELQVAPDQPGFRGSADIVVQLDRARQSVWLHGRKLHVTAATATPEGGSPIAATWQEKDPHGIGALTLSSPLPAGKATLHFEFDAPFAEGRTGLYKVTEAGIPYAFTQFEPVDARGAFPCFDEPGFKIPFSISLVVPSGAQAVANTPELDRAQTPDGSTRIHFADTKPIPSYVVAFAVGPLDIVAAPDAPPNGVRNHPLPFRGVTVKGRGKELAYALRHGPEILATLERYFGTEYPYEKLDLIAVPEKNGAMENPGAVTFDEQLILVDEKSAPMRQKLAFATVVSHELAHQWFGDLVTMKWWDDTWLNESFASWIQGKIADEWNPATQARMDTLDGVQYAIGLDSLVSSRAIHQPILAPDDIENSFDGITYQKGAGVLTMFERWLGEDTFRAGVQLHLSQHRYGNATADDFLSALSIAAKRDVAGALHTFLDQPGLPYVEADLRCDGGPPRLHLKQSRFLPAGSTGDANKTWQVPVCARYEVGGKVQESCSLLTDREGDLPIGGTVCPTWVFPNPDAAGYYRFALAPKDLAALKKYGVAKLSARDKIAFANSLRAAFNHGTTSFADSLSAATALAGDPNPEVSDQPAGFLDTAHDWLYQDKVEPAIEAYTRKLYAPELAKLGWTGKNGEGAETIKRRTRVIGTLAGLGHDPRTRAEAKRRALAYLGIGKDGEIHKDALDANLAGTVLGIAGEDANGPLFDALLARLAKTEDEQLRGQILGALCSARDPAIAARVRDLVLDTRLRVTEVMVPLYYQLNMPETRDATWAWMKKNWDALVARQSGNLFGGAQAFRAVSGMCDETSANDVASFLTDRAKTVDGAPRELASAIEQIRLCVAKRTAQEKNARDFFAHAEK